MTVLVLTAHDDETATRVCHALDDRGADHARMDLGDFPEKLSVTADLRSGSDWTGSLSGSGRDLPLAEISAVYYRRPSAFGLSVQMSAEHRRFAAAEARQGLGGLLSSLRVPFVNRPSRIADAELKVVQLQAAAALGFLVPPTLITSVGSKARAFARDVGTLMYKPLSSPFLREDDHVKLVYATLVSPGELDDDEISRTSCQFQAFVPKRYDVRLTAVGSECFAAVIHAGSEASRIDWRADYPSLTYESIDTPEPVAAAVGAYLDQFGLSFGCFDFSVAKDTGDWWFLECNANGAWGWIADETAMPIAAAIANLLTLE